MQTGLLPQITTGIAHRRAGVGQVGAGLVQPPVACFEAALRALGAPGSAGGCQRVLSAARICAEPVTKPKHFFTLKIVASRQ